MKKTLILMALWLVQAMAAKAIPADSRPVSVVQPDGSRVTVSLHGDEYYHYHTTDDGYTVVRDDGGYFVYARLDDGGQLAPTRLAAHDAAHRTPAERAFLATTQKHLAPATTARGRQMRQQEQQRQAQARQMRREPQYDYNDFRGLILLVEFNDRSFSRTDYADVINDMVNQEDYTGYNNTEWGRYTGSVRDYYYDNSGGLFSPQFDIVGPVKIDYSQYDPHSTDNANAIVQAAIDAADDVVDYSQYDRDGDGIVDLVYFIFAGVGANVSGNNSNLIWPHAGAMWNENGGWDDWLVVRDGVGIYRYACSTELYGTSTWSVLDGIGVICHEFGHVLGLPDLYDTDYEGGGGQSAHPGEWSIMAGGGYLNNGRTPAGYTLYERYAIGFAMPEVIDSVGSYTLQPIGTSNRGYRLNTRVDREFFLIENRQQTSKWDRYIPGHGMLVFRVDSTSSRVWERNEVNSNPAHNYFEMLRAGGGTANNGSNPFPGTRRVTTLSNASTPASLLTWGGMESPWGFENIREVQGELRFDVTDVNVLRAIALPASYTVAQGIQMQMREERTPDYAPYTLEWQSSDEGVATIDADGMVTTLATGVTTITVRANGDDQLTAACTLTVADMPLATDIAAFKREGATTDARLQLADAEVLRVYRDYVFVRDTTGALVLTPEQLPAATGQQVGLTLYGRYAPADSLPRVESRDIYPATLVDLGPTVTPEPIVLTPAELTLRHYGDLITLHQVQLQKLTEPLSGVYVVGADRRIKLTNAFAITGIRVPTDLTRYYDVTGILTTRHSADEEELVDDLWLTEKVTAVSAPVENSIASAAWTVGEPVGVYTPDGRLVARTTAGSLRALPLRRGLYVVRSPQGSRKVLLP